MFFKKVLFFFSTTVFLIVFSPASEQASQEIVRGETGNKLDTYLTGITPFGFSGALLVVKDGEILLNKGYGLAVRSENIPNSSETVFSVGSITKQFTAAGIMKLEMMGQLDSKDSITKYFENVPEDKKSITLHHLLTHSSGMETGTGPDFVKVFRDETVRKVLDAPLHFKPGEQFEYSNAGYSILAAVIEKVSGKSYEEFLNDYLFKPAGMEFTGYKLPDWNKRVVAHWYVGTTDNGKPLDKPYPYWNFIGNGGILSTTMDMYKWHEALVGDDVLSAAVKKKMFTPYINDYGYGWDVLETERGLLIQHDGGSSLGCSAEFRRYLGAGIVTMLFCNQSYEQKTLMRVVRDKIHALVFGGEVNLPPTVKTSFPGTISRFTADYKFPGGGSFKVKTEGEKLLIQAADQLSLNALFALDKREEELYKELNRSSVSIFEAALKGDYQPFEKVLRYKERRIGPVRQHIQMRLERYKIRTGEIKKVIVHYTLPADLDGEEAALTTVQLKGEKGSIFFGLYWSGKENIGVTPVMGARPVSVPFLRAGENGFAGYHIDMARTFQCRFKQDEEGEIIALVFKTKDGEQEAKKIKGGTS